MVLYKREGPFCPSDPPCISWIFIENWRVLQSLVASYSIQCPPPRLNIDLISTCTITSKRYQQYARSLNRGRSQMSQKERSSWRALELDRGQLCTVQCSAHTEMGCARLPHSPLLGTVLRSALKCRTDAILGTAPPVAALWHTHLCRPTIVFHHHTPSFLPLSSLLLPALAHLHAFPPQTPNPSSMTHTTEICNITNHFPAWDT